MMGDETSPRGVIGTGGAANSTTSKGLNIRLVNACDKQRGPIGVRRNGRKTSKYNISISGHDKRNRLSALIESDILIQGAKILPKVTWYDYTGRTMALRKQEADLVDGNRYFDEQSKELAKRTKRNLQNPIKCSADIRITGTGKGVETVTLVIKGRKGTERLACAFDMNKSDATFEQFQALSEKTARKAVKIAHRLHKI